MELNNNYVCDQEVKHLSENDVHTILKNYFANGTNFSLESFKVHIASDKMLGFLADYWKLKVNVLRNEQKIVLSFFIKAVSRSNAAKAAMVKDLNLFDKEVFFYSVIKKNFEIEGVKPWSPKLAALLHEAVVFEDLSAKNYHVRDKYLRFDQNHTEQALQAVARFHASSIVFEERKSKVLKRQYRIENEYEQLLDTSGYNETDTWFVQCRNGALEALKSFSKHANDEGILKLVESKWNAVWANALKTRWTADVRKVICHRDLWNNNIMFHYDDAGKVDDCLMVDYQAVMCQPPASDVMLLLYCNLDPQYREENMAYFLDFYYNQLKDIVANYDVDLESVIPKKDFLDLTEEQRNWGLILCACLIPQFWVSDELTTNIFSDSAQFDEILSKNKGVFIKRMMMENIDYMEKVLEIFEEIVERYCLI